MSNVIDFLEQMGRDAHLRHLAGLELQAALTQAGIEPSVRAAVVGGDQRLLESLIDASHPLCCLIHPVEEETEKDDEGKEDEDDEAEAEDDEDEADGK